MNLLSRVFQNALQRGNSLWRVFKFRCAPWCVCIAILQLLALSGPVAAEARAMVPGQILLQVIHFGEVGHGKFLFGIPQLLDKPGSYWRSGFVELLPVVEKDVEPVPQQKPREKAREIKEDSVGDDNGGELLKHCFIFLCYALAGFLCVYRRRE